MGTSKRIFGGDNMRIHRDHNFVKNVDFSRLNEILEEKGVTKAELSRKCGYCTEYVSKHVFRKKRLTQTVANTLEKVYGVSPDEYTYKETKKSTSNDDATETTASNDDTYEFTIKLDGELLKELALKSVINHISVEDFVRDCVINGICEGRKDR